MPQGERRPVTGDGICLYRAIALSISNSEQDHEKIRRMTCLHALENQQIFSSFVRDVYENLAEYIRK